MNGMTVWWFTSLWSAEVNIGWDYAEPDGHRLPDEYLIEVSM